MTNKLKALVLVAMTGVFLGMGSTAFAQLGLPGDGVADGATGGGLEAAAIGEMGDTEHGPCVEDILDLPALNVCADAQGRVIMDLPALKLVGPGAAPADATPAPTAAPRAPGAPDRLPVTGVNVGDIFALGMAALSGGGVLLRRLRMSLAS